MTAVKADAAKPAMAAIDPAFRLAMGRVLGMGDTKYGPANWMRGLAYSRLVGAAHRHLAAYESGEKADPETGESHLVHAACSLMMLNRYDIDGREELDDQRYKGKMPGLRKEKGPGRVFTEPDREVRLDVQAVCKPDEKCEARTETREGASVDPVRRLQDRISRWADSVFPDRTAHGALCKLVLEEIPELLHNGLDDPMEYADVLILILDIASLRGIDAIAAAHRKMDVNEARSWVVDTSTGLMRHIEND